MNALEAQSKAPAYKADLHRLVVLRRRLKKLNVAHLIRSWIEKAEKELESEAIENAGGAK